MAAGIICQGCGIEAPCRQVEFNQNIGALVMRFRRTYRGEMCKRCVHRFFWKATGVNLTLGWWGYISLVITPIFTVANTVRYIGALGMEGVPPGAKVPQLTDEIIGKLAPFRAEIVQRLNANEPLIAVANDVAMRAAVTPGTVVKYVIAISRPPAAPVQRPTGGFPVQPIARQAPPPLPVESLPLMPQPTCAPTVPAEIGIQP